MISYGYTGAAMIMFRSQKAHDLNGIQRHVLIMLASYAGNNGLCWPSHKELAKVCGYGVTAIKRNLKIIEELGYITVTKRKNDKGELETNLYLINLEKTAPVKKSKVVSMKDYKTTEEKLFDRSWDEDSEVV